MPTNVQLPNFITAENELDGNEPVYISQAGKTRKTLLQKIKDFIIGTTALTTTDQTITGAIEEIKGIADANTISLSDVAHKTGTMQANLNADMVDGIQGNQITIKSIINITYYVNATSGSDTNDGLSSATPFKTIQHAFNSLPQIINHTINIYIASGSYDEDIVLGGLYGSGSVNIIGDSVVSNSRSIKSLFINNCCLPVLVQGLMTTTTSRNDINISNSNAIVIEYCNLVTTTSYIGVFVTSSAAYLHHNTISNKGTAIQSYVNSKVLVSSNNGSNNGVALQAQYNGTIGKESNSITGTTNESTYAGGVIR